MRVVYGTLKQDQPAFLNDGMTMADGVFPIANGYAPMPSFSASPNGDLGGRCYGGAAYRIDGETFIFAATAAKIRRYTTSGYSDVATGLTTTADAGMRFAAYANLMLATNGTDPIKKFDPNSPSAFTDLNAGAPTARFIGVVKGFVIVAYADDENQRVQWSSNNDPSAWVVGTLESGLSDLAGGGDITGFVGGDYGLVFQEGRITRMDYSADDAVWQFSEISTDVGCIAPWSLASFGKLSFFLSSKGFMACDGTTVQAIGSETIDRTFLAALDLNYISAMSAAVDPRTSLYMVSVPSADPPQNLYAYQYGLQRWSTAGVSIERMFSALGLSVSLEDLDAIYGNLDAIPVSLDSAAFRGGYPLLMAFGAANAIGSLSGPPLACTMTDGLAEMFPGMVSRISAVRPLTDAATATVTVSVAPSLADALVATEFTARTNGGYFRMRKSGNLSQVKVSIPAGAAWSFILGYDADAVAGGRA